MIHFILEVARRFRYFLTRTKLDAELREEMETHLAMLAQDTPPLSAAQRMGNLTRWQEISREAWTWNWMESLLRDTGHGFRLLLKSPAFTLTACLSLAIGLGSTIGVISLMNALIFKALPVPDPQQLWALGHGNPQEHDDRFSYPAFAAFSRLNKTGVPFFATAGDYVDADYGDGAPVHNTPVLVVSGDAFRILKLEPYAGRLLTPDDDLPGIPHGANCLLSYRLWQSRFRGDPSAIGSHVTVGAVQFTIVGVAPPRFFGFYVGSQSDLILPIAGYAATNPAQKILEARGWTWLAFMTRVPPDMGISGLTAALNAIYPAVRHESSFSAHEETGLDRLYLDSVSTGFSVVRTRFSRPLYVLFAMTGLILLIACANVANLLLVRSVVRYREMAVRLALGATRSRVLRQLLTESVLIAALGAMGSIPVYFACTRGLVTFLRSGPDANIFLDTRADWRLIASTLILVSATTLLFGFAPALRVTRSDVNVALGESSARLAARSSFGRFIVALQISLSLVLLLGAALLARSLYELRTFNPGFRRDHILIANVDTTQTIHGNAEVVRFFDQLTARVRALPGVRSAAASIVLPLSGQAWRRDYEIRENAASGIRQQNSFENWIAPRYFETMGTPLILGRDIHDSDSAAAPPVALVNESLARRFSGGNPIGQRIFDKNKAITIVGVVGDARYRRLRDDAPPTVYRPLSQLPPSFEFLLQLHLEVWTAAPATSLAAPVRDIVKHLNGSSVVDTKTFDSLIDENLLYERLLAALSAAFGFIGLLLSAIGVYGLSAYSVARRTGEIGIRMALGATPRSVLRLILADHARLLLTGAAAGSLMSIVLTRFLRAWLFGVSATDPALFIAALAILSTAAMSAAFVPARRAARLNPVTALRHE
jgi:putative ABC transport system permease protein